MHRLLALNDVFAMESESLEIEKEGRKWKVVGSTDEWIFRRVFNRKWKADIAVEVYKSGGKWKEYCQNINQEPYHAIEAMRKANAEITKLSPTCEEITAYGDYLNGTKTNGSLWISGGK